MMPYLYSLSAKVHFDDYTLMRPLVMDFTDDALSREISDQFMLGPALMVCPVYEYGSRSRSVYLPEGGWYDFHNDEFLEGGCRITADAPLERIPLYFRSGSIMLMSPVVQSTAQSQDYLTICVFGGGDADFGLYEDDGTSYDYEKGEYSTVDFHWDELSRTLKVSDRNGAFQDVALRRNFLVVLREADPSGAVRENVQTLEYDGSAVSVAF